MGPGTEKKLGLAAIRNAGQGKQGEKVKDAVNAAIAVSLHRHDTLPQTFAAVGEAIKQLRKQ
jgi:hypothetical protein